MSRLGTRRVAVGTNRAAMTIRKGPQKGPHGLTSLVCHNQCASIPTPPHMDVACIGVGTDTFGFTWIMILMMVTALQAVIVGCGTGEEELQWLWC